VPPDAVNGLPMRMSPIGGADPPEVLDHVAEVATIRPRPKVIGPRLSPQQDRRPQPDKHEDGHDGQVERVDRKQRELRTSLPRGADWDLCSPLLCSPCHLPHRRKRHARR